MKQNKCLKKIIFLAIICSLFFCDKVLATITTYDYNAILVPDGNHPGVYEVAIVSNNNEDATIGIQSIAKQNLENNPTAESPAIIMGAAVPFERKTDTTIFTRTDGGTGEVGIYAPYNKFRYQILEERAADGNTHRKLSGYDGSYVIVRVDVSNLINAVPVAERENSYLHVRHEGNAVLMVEMGPGGTTVSPTFSDGLGNKVGVYPLEANAIALKDTDGSMMNKPYIDVIFMSSGTLVAGADTEIIDPTKPSADFKIKIYIDQIKDYNPSLVYDPNYQPPSPTAPTMEALMMGKYYFDDTLFEGGHYPAGTVKPTATVSSYKMKGSDIELEVVNGDNGTGSYLNPSLKYWSLRKAMKYELYNDSPIKLICEVPVLEGLLIDGTSYSGNRKVILDVNSFDIQIANHKETDAAGLTIKNAEMMLKDSFNTTGAELAVGNNAKMILKEGGTFIIDETCQLEVEYDAASTTTPSEAQKLNNGVISIENNGKIVNNGVFTIEGTEGKPIASPSVVRDMQNAVLDIKEGGLLENNGCLLSYGELYCMGTIKNYGEYNDVIISQDPDKGNFSYHRGIQVSWKDDVTQDCVTMGALYIGKDKLNNINTNALLENNGDIVLVPGVLDCYGILKNNSSGNVYACPVEEAMIPINPTVDKPLIVEKLVRFGEPIKSRMYINENGLIENEGNIKATYVEIINNGRTGNLTPIGPDNRLFKNLDLFIQGTALNSGNILLDTVYTYGEITNTGDIGTKVIISKINNFEGVLYDDAVTKLEEVYNASKTISGSRNIWKYASCREINVSPGNQKCRGGTIPSWTVRATTNESGNGIKYWVDIFEDVNPEPVKKFKVEANVDTSVVGPILLEMNRNVIYNFRIFDGNEIIEDTASITVSSEHITTPSEIGNLIYNGEEQKLITTGGSNMGTLEYRLGTTGVWDNIVPSAKNAGNYRVYYKLSTESEARGFTDIVISKRQISISGSALSSKVGTALKPLQYVVNGLLAGDVINGVTISSTANNAVVGEYPITVNVTGSNPNYDITLYTSTYTVTNGDLDVEVKDKYGVFSDDVSYKGFNIDLMAPNNVTPYYSLDTELTASNYDTVGWTSSTIPNLPAGAGTHIVYYYVTDGIDVIKGSKYVIIEKATQLAPDKVLARAETAKYRGDCWIEGLEPRQMEYRRVDNDGTYTLAYYEKEYVLPGNYLVRRIGDSNHYPSPDYFLTVADGASITVKFFKNDEEMTPINIITGLNVGDIILRPEDPVWEGHHFLDWYSGDMPFNFNKPLISSCEIIAYWDNSPPHVHNTLLVVATPSTCTEYGNIAYYKCTMCSRWFEDAFALVEIRDRASVIIEPLGHNWNSGVITRQPTYTKEGIRTFTCLRDSRHTKTETIPKKKNDNSGGSSDNYDPNMKLVKDENANGKWIKTIYGWQYLQNGKVVENEWQSIKVNDTSYWYYFGTNGLMVTGFIYWNNNIYYLYPVLDGNEGYMLVGWQQIAGKWYYFEQTPNENLGRMYFLQKTPDGYFIGIDGTWDGKPANINK